MLWRSHSFIFSRHGAYWKQTHILPYNRPHTHNPTNPHPTHLIHKQPLAGKHRLTKTLALIILHHSLRARHKSIAAHTPRLLPREADIRHITQRMWREQNLPRTRVSAVHHLPADEEFLHAEFDRAFEGHGGGHGDHEARLDGEGAADGELDGDDGVGVAVGDAVGAAVEGAGVVDGGGGAGELRAGGGHGAACGVGCSWGHGEVFSERLFLLFGGVGVPLRTGVDWECLGSF